jgi:hypothetical protein
LGFDITVASRSAMAVGVAERERVQDIIFATRALNLGEGML